MKALHRKQVDLLIGKPYGISLYIGRHTNGDFQTWSFEIKHTGRLKGSRFDETRTIYSGGLHYSTREDAALHVEQFFGKLNEHIVRRLGRVKIEKRLKDFMLKLFNVEHRKGLFKLCIELDLIEFNRQPTAFMQSKSMVTPKFRHWLDSLALPTRKHPEEYTRIIPGVRPKFAPHTPHPAGIKAKR